MKMIFIIMFMLTCFSTELKRLVLNEECSQLSEITCMGSLHGHNPPNWQPRPVIYHQYFGNYLLPVDIQTNSLLSIPHPHFHFSNLYQSLPVESYPRLGFRKEQREHLEDLATLKPTQNVIVSPKEEIRVKDVEISNIRDLQMAPLRKPPSLAPFRAHPLLHYIKNRNTIDPNKIITFRSNDIRKAKEDITTLILKPVARSVAGVDGKAVSTPLSKAILRQGTNVDILFEPEAVAIAGPGGIAHAESDLEIIYEDIV